MMATKGQGLEMSAPGLHFCTTGKNVHLNKIPPENKKPEVERYLAWMCSKMCRANRKSHTQGNADGIGSFD